MLWYIINIDISYICVWNVYYIQCTILIITIHFTAKLEKNHCSLIDLTNINNNSLFIHVLSTFLLFTELLFIAEKYYYYYYNYYYRCY